MLFARNTDPETSHEAAGSIEDEAVTKTQLAIMAILRYRPMTDQELVVVYRDLVEFGDAPQASESGIRSRRSQLVKAGKVEPVGETKTLANRRTIVWGLTK
jgi:hypothetical protein